MSTNFTLINKERAEKLVGLGIDHMNISMWAGTAEIYVKTHPNKKEDDFYRMRDMLIYLGKLKKKEGKKKPIINIYNVIFNMNFHEIKKMIDFAFLVNADSVDFTMMDPVEGRTEILLLNEEQRCELIEEINKVKDYVNKKNAEFGVELRVNALDQFLRRISNENSKEGNYDSNIIDTIPCYAGWTFARVMANGNILSCLKSHLMPISNIYKQSFKKAWYSKKQRLFREKSKCKKSDSYFSKINCYKSCDNLGTNLSIHGKIQSLPAFSKFLLKNLTFILKSKGKKL
jgi:MoaA/NifB/PqqE/SkfB family radical SAM enzyme